MGYPTYSSSTRASTGRTEMYSKRSIEENFSQIKERKAHDSMLPANALMRESRDSENHPNSIPMILALDLTGSMGSIPQHFIGEGLPTMISKLQEKTNDIALLLLGVGDHTCDRYPLQIGQFESGDQELDVWLSRIYPESGGGSNYGESYLLAWYYAAYHTESDAWDKRKKRGFIFTIGDEPTLGVINGIEGTNLEPLFNEQQLGILSAESLLAKARERYHIIHIHLTETRSGSRQDVQQGWKDLMGQTVLFVDDYKKIPETISKSILNILESDSYVSGNTTPPKEEPKKQQEIL